MPNLVRLRNISHQDLQVAPLGGQVVKADYVIDIPAVVYERYVWPEQTWRVETPGRAAKKEE